MANKAERNSNQQPSDQLSSQSYNQGHR
jgi:hypothetical protein